MISEPYPNDKSDAYVAHLDGDNIRIELETLVCFDAFKLPFVAPTSASFPPSLTHKQMEIHHTFGVRLIGVSDMDVLDEFSNTPGELEKLWLKWKEWIFHNSTLDRRISYIEIEEAQIEGFNMEEITLEEVMTFLSQRKRDNCVPITRWANPLSPSPLTLDEFRDFIIALGPNLRVLYLDEVVLSGIKDMSRVISILDEVCPGLQYLEFWPQSPTTDELSGLYNLRKLTLHNTKKEVEKIGLRKFCRHLARLGSDETVYQNTAFQTVYKMYKVNLSIHWVGQIFWTLG